MASIWKITSALTVAILMNGATLHNSSYGFAEHATAHAELAAAQT